MSLNMYLIKRILIMIPTIFGVTMISFIIINIAPGSPLEQKIHQMRFGQQGDSGGGLSKVSDSLINSEIMEELKKQYGFDKPIHIRYWIWIKNISKLDFGISTSYGDPVIEIIKDRFPVSLQFGIASYLFTYLLSVPMGMLLALKSGSIFDRATRFCLYVFYAIPPLILSIVLIILMAGSSYLNLFPTGGFVSDDYSELSFGGKIIDRIHHFILPLFVYVISGFTTHSMLMRNSTLEVLSEDYIRTARSKGLPMVQIQSKHIMKNALIPMINGMGSFFSIFFTGSFIVETIFRIEGIGYLSYKALMDRDYNLIMGIIFLSSMFMMMGRLMSDLLYPIVDPRIKLS